MNKKGKGAITIEAVMLMPMIIISIVLMIDVSLNAYLKSAVSSCVDLAISSVEYELKAKNDGDLLCKEDYCISPDTFIRGRLSRGISDELHVGINTGIIKSRIVESIVTNTGVDASKVDVSVRKNSFLFTSYISVNCRVELPSVMSRLYRKLNLDFDVLRSEKSIVIRDYFDMISLSESVARALKRNKSITEIIDAVNNLAYYVSKIIGG